MSICLRINDVLSEGRGGMMFCAVLLLALSGCSSNNNSDLQQKLVEIKAIPAGKIPPLPVFKPYQKYIYSATVKQDPFTSLETGMVDPEPTCTDCEIPPSPFVGDGHNPEALEEYPLDTLRYVGQMVSAGRDWAIVTSPDMIVHRVKTGNFLGQNYGKIIAIEEGKIELVEKVFDEFRQKWIDRDAALSLTE